MDRLTVAYERVWDAFRRSQSTADGRHDTPHWRAHDGPYAACVVRVPAEALQPNLTVLRAQLAETRRRSPAPRSFPAHHASGTRFCRRDATATRRDQRDAARGVRSINRRADLEYARPCRSRWEG